MRTAIINTDFWKDESIFELNTDTRLFYLAILTNPERNTSPAFKCSDRIMSAFTGYDKDLLPLLRKQLVEQGRIMYEDGYYIILDQAYIKPTKGKLSNTLLEKYLSELPDNIRKIVDTFLMSGSCATIEYKDNNKTKDKEEYKEQEKTKERFDIFRNLYKTALKGKTKSLDSEYNNFKKKYPKLNTLEEIKRIEILTGKFYVEIKKQFDNGKEDAFNYVPHFTTYINQSRWEHYEN